MRRPRATGAVLAVIVLALAACSSREPSVEVGNPDDRTNAAENRIPTDDCPSGFDTAGIDGNTVRLVSSFPQSGLTSPFAQISKGYKAFFDKINKEEGGVEVGGRRYLIKVDDLDDQYEPAKTLQNIRQLVGPDGKAAFAVFNVVSTSGNLAIRKDLAEHCVPNLFAATGDPMTGNPKYPWMIGSTLAPYTLEAVTFVNNLKESQPDAKVGMLVQDDEFGEAYLAGVRRAISGTNIKIVKVERYAAGSNEVSAQVTSLKGSGADTFFNGATLLACPSGLKAAYDIGWTRVSTFVGGTCIVKTLMGLVNREADGVYAATNLKDPQDGRYDRDPAMIAFRDTIKTYGAKDADPENALLTYGYTQAVILKATMENARKMTRTEVMRSARNLNQPNLGTVQDGVTVRTGPGDPYVAENLQLLRYDSRVQHFNPVGIIYDYEGRTKELTPAKLINL